MPLNKDPLKFSLRPKVEDVGDSLTWKFDSKETTLDSDLNSRDTTRSTAVRDTQVRFLNETGAVRFKGDSHSKEPRQVKPKLTCVDVQVPGQEKPKPEPVNVTYTKDGQQGNKRRLKKTLKDIEDKSGNELLIWDNRCVVNRNASCMVFCLADGLSKLKELIMKQRSSLPDQGLYHLPIYFLLGYYYCAA